MSHITCYLFNGATIWSNVTYLTLSLIFRHIISSPHLHFEIFKYAHALWYPWFLVACFVFWWLSSFLCDCFTGPIMNFEILFLVCCFYNTFCFKRWKIICKTSPYKGWSKFSLFTDRLRLRLSQCAHELVFWWRSWWGGICLEFLFVSYRNVVLNDKQSQGADSLIFCGHVIS